jgi:hypothetical protein
MKLTINMTGFESLQKEIKETVTKQDIQGALLDSVLLVEREAKIRCPVQFGILRDSITHHKISDLTYEIGAYAKYADYIEFGTMSHWVEPTNKQALHWKIKGEDFFSKGHMVSGIKVGTPEQPFIYKTPKKAYPSYRPFLRSALYSKLEEINRIFENRMNK